MLKRILIANRGEIALRILRTCREMGIETVAVFSEADQDSLHVQLAGQAVCIGPARAADSYLNQNTLLTAARATGCDGIHPGYGFLSENADFADACTQAGLTFIGPSGDVIRRAGAKSAARTLMQEAGVPVTPGSDGPVRSEAEAQAAAEQVGYPVMLEAPAWGLAPEVRKKMQEAAVRAARAVGYESAGTVEFLLEPDGERFYFMEMNTRIQVEHGITELVTGVDIVRQQLRIASGLPLDLADILCTGHAIECRINAEDPDQGFMPCPGKADFLHLPGGPGVRVDTCLYEGCELPPYYDSLAAKLMVHAPTRLEAVRKMRRCLEEFTLEGFPTTAELCYQLMHHPAFVRGGYAADCLDVHLPELLEFSHRLAEMEDGA